MAPSQQEATIAKDKFNSEHSKTIRQSRNIKKCDSQEIYNNVYRTNLFTHPSCLLPVPQQSSQIRGVAGSTPSLLGTATGHGPLLVLVDIATLTKPAAAMIAFVRLLTKVHSPNMLGQSAFMREGCRAPITLELANLMVHCGYVLQEIVFPLEHGFAHWTRCLLLGAATGLCSLQNCVMRFTELQTIIVTVRKLIRHRLISGIRQHHRAPELLPLLFAMLMHCLRGRRTMRMRRV